MPEEALASCQLKLGRAKAHLEELEASIQGFRDEGNYRLVRHEEREGRDVTWTWDVVLTKPFPLDWAILTGEALYQVHSALDHLAWHLAARESFPKQPDNVTFPIFASHPKFWRSNGRGGFRQSSGGWAVERMPTGAAQLVEEVQPYYAGNKPERHPLWLLHVLSNEDKHKTLHIARAAATNSQLKRRHIEGFQILSFKVTNGEPFDDCAESVGTMRARFTASHAEIDVQPSFSFEEVFGVGSPTPALGRPVFATLVTILNYVIADVFRERFVPFVS